MELNSKIFVAGHNGLLGSSIVRELNKQGYTNIITMPREELDLCDPKMVAWFFSVYRPEYVFLAAAKVGGITYNKSFPADFLYDNLLIQNNVIYYSKHYDVKKLLFIGSSCIYPKNCPQPMKEEYLLDGKLEETNEAYSIAKIAGLKLCSYYKTQYGFNAISVMPTNLYGVNDTFDLKKSHVIPAMINKFVKAKESNESVTLFGDGSPIREFLYIDDAANACIFLMNNYESNEHINIGSSQGYTINNLANIIANKVGFTGDIHWDTTKPNGTPVKLLDSSKLNSLGWSPQIDFEEGIEKTILWYIETGGKRNV